MFSEKIEQLIAVLERQELETNNVSAQLYAELFAAYLYRDDLHNARFLWKRIPQNIKNGNMELEKMHKIFQCLWNNETPGFYKEINYEWSKNVAEVMFELKERVQMESVNLIGKAYSSIFEDVFADMTNQTPEMIVDTCKGLGWEIKTEGLGPRLIEPKKIIIDKGVNTSAETQLNKLTEIISFLEN